MKEPLSSLFMAKLMRQVLPNGGANTSHFLFARNIRSFKGTTDVNDSLIRTLRHHPEHFWYFKQTALRFSVLRSRRSVSAVLRATVDFLIVKRVSIVNGAQTVGVIGSMGQDLDKEEQPPRVLVRLISLEDCPQGFEKEVTRATNTQNRIERRDFASLDPNQQRLASEFLLDGKHYAYKTGDEEAAPENGCSIGGCNRGYGLRQPRHEPRGRCQARGGSTLGEH